MIRKYQLGTHLVLLFFLALTMLPFVFVVNNSFRSQSEQYRSFFGFPEAAQRLAHAAWQKISGQEAEIRVVTSKLSTSSADGVAESESVQASEQERRPASFREAAGAELRNLTRGYRMAWKDLRGYMVNTLLISLVTTAGILVLGSISGYVFSRYRFPGRGVLFALLLSIIMIPPVLTLVPSFLLVKELGLLNSYLVLVLPYVAGGQILAIFLFKSFFDGLPEELFESARIEGAGHLAIYRHVVLPLSGNVCAVVSVITILGVWNNFLWPLITNTDAKYHVVSSGLYLMSQGAVGQSFSTMSAAFVLSSLPLLVLFLYATKPFMQGVTSGAFK